MISKELLVNAVDEKASVGPQKLAISSTENGEEIHLH